MLNRIISSIFLFLSTIAFAFELPVESTYSVPSNIPMQNTSFLMNNRPLAKVHGRVFSLLDVIKKMDLLIHEYYPDIKESPSSLLQFYNSQWKPTLIEMINSELMVADAEEKEIKVSDGDVREEMETRFGPNIISNLDKLGLQYDEARKLVHTELITRQMSWYNIHSHANQKVTPKTIKEAYIASCIANPPKDEWKYQVLSIRGKDKTLCSQIAENAANLLKTDISDLDVLSSVLKKQSNNLDANEISISVSQEYLSDEKVLATQHKSILTSLKDGSFSLPVEQISRIDNSIVYRIFHLKAHHKGEKQLFETMCDNLKNSLMDKAVKQERQIYLTYLYKKFGFSEEQLKEFIPEYYQPFLPS